MPLRFYYGKDKLKKADLSSVVERINQELLQWASAFTTDIEIAVKKLNDLKKIIQFFPQELPIYFVAGKLLDENLRNEGLLELLMRHDGIRITTALKGHDGPGFGLRVFTWNPHFRGFAYYKPDVDEAITTVIIDPNQYVAPVAVIESVCKKLRSRIALPAFSELSRDQSYGADDDSVSVRQSGINSLTITLRANEKALLIELVRACLECAESPKSVGVEFVGTWSDVSESLRVKLTSDEFLITKCGVDTIGSGEIGSIENLNYELLCRILTDAPKSADIKIKWANIEFKKPIDIRYDGSINLLAERRSLSCGYSFLIENDDYRSPEVSSFAREMKELTGLPFDKSRYWIPDGYAGEKYQKTIAGIKAFSRGALEASNKVAEGYRIYGRDRNLNIAGYYDSEPGLFAKVEESVPFKQILIEEMKAKYPEFLFDQKGSIGQYGSFSFASKDPKGLFDYIIFDRDPSWGSKIFTITLAVNKYMMIAAGAETIGYWWVFKRDARFFIGRDAWWPYKSVDSLRSAMQNSFLFIDDVGPRFFDEAGRLLLQHFRVTQNE